MFVQLIDTEYLFLHTIIDKNTDPGILNPAIIIAADTNIQEILGYNLYQTLMDMVSNNTIDVVQNLQYKTLLNNFVQPALAHHSVFHALPAIQYHLTNKAILSKTTDHATTTGLKELIYLRETTKHYADFYSQRIREYIMNNPSSFPEYFQSVGVQHIKPKRTTYFSGWSGSHQGGKPKGNGGHGDPDCLGCDPTGYPMNW